MAESKPKEIPESAWPNLTGLFYQKLATIDLGGSPVSNPRKLLVMQEDEVAAPSLNENALEAQRQAFDAISDELTSLPQLGAYFSTRGKWRPVQNETIWEVELYDIDHKTTGGYATLTLPVVGESPPYGIELAINHDEGYYIRYARSHDKQ